MVQAVAAALSWMWVDDWPGPSWSNTDFGEWLALAVAWATLLTAVGAAVARRWWVTAAIAVGCLLATGFGSVVFLGYALTSSA